MNLPREDIPELTIQEEIIARIERLELMAASLQKTIQTNRRYTILSRQERVSVREHYARGINKTTLARLFDVDIKTIYHILKEPTDE